MNIKTGIDYLSEGIALLTCLGKDQPLKKYIDNYLYEANLDKKAFYEERKEALDFLFQVEKEAQKEFKKDQDLIAYYFGSSYEDEKTDCIGRIILLWEEYNHVEDGTLEEYKKELADLSEDEYYIYFGYKVQFFNDNHRDFFSASMPQTKEDVLLLIINSEFTEKQKLMFTDALVNHTEHLTKIFDLIEKAMSLLQNHEDEILSLYAGFASYWESKFKGQYPVRYFCENNEDLQYLLCDNPYGCTITIELFHPFIKGFSVGSDENGLFTSIAMPMGILYCDACPLDYTRGEKRLIDNTAFYLTALKQISHISRFQILSCTKDKEAYGNELAEHLGLTNATVSHHTSLLTMAELLRETPMGTQVLYSSNRETIKNCLDFLKKELL